MEGRKRISCTAEQFGFNLVEMRRVVNRRDGEHSKDILEESSQSILEDIKRAMLLLLLPLAGTCGKVLVPMHVRSMQEGYCRRGFITSPLTHCTQC